MKTAAILILAIAAAPALAHPITSFELEQRDIEYALHSIMMVLTNICMQWRAATRRHR